jgi:hypothetical protein
MKVIALIADVNCQTAPLNDEAGLLIEYSCGDRCLNTTMFVTVDLARTEDQIREDVRVAVAADSNSKCETQITSADVRVF